MQVAVKSPILETQNDVRKSIISPAIGSRGARFLSLVKSNKLDVSPQLSKRITLNNKQNVMELMRNVKKEEGISDQYLKFNSIFDPTSSPSQGILSKRKPETPDSPANISAKRKRVSFNDPVSTTKEYLITEEEERLKSASLIRCLTYDNNEEEEEEDRDVEGIEKITELEINSNENVESDDIKMGDDEQVELVKNEQVTKEEVKDNSQTTAHPIILDHNYDDRDENNTQNTDITTSSLDEEPPSDCLTFKDKDEMIDYLNKNMNIDEILERVILQSEEENRKQLIAKAMKTIELSELLAEILPFPSSENNKMTTEQMEFATGIVNHVSKLMKSSDRVKHKVLEMLSEKHPKDFLTHSLQENSITAVCEKITIPNIVNYLIHKINVCDNDELDVDINKLNRAILHNLLTNANTHREIKADPKETQEFLKLVFKNARQDDILDNVADYLKSVFKTNK